jgi:Tfp pilus assembly protein PilO
MRFPRFEMKNQLLYYQRVERALLALLVVTAVGIYFFGIRPAAQELDQVHQQYAAACDELDQDQERAKSLPRVDLEIDRLRQRVERFDKKLPRQQDLTSFISDVTRIGRQASVHKLAWHLNSKPASSDQLRELPIQFTFQGDFQTGVMTFLRDTEEMQRLTRVRRLSLTSTDARDGQVRAELTMNIYFGEQ